jgi:Zn-dependent membrane protease YugP
MSSSESDFEIDENSCLGYQYEPEYTEEELNAQSVENASNSTQKYVVKGIFNRNCLYYVTNSCVTWVITDKGDKKKANMSASSRVITAAK